MHGHVLAGPSRHCVVKHLAGCVGILDLVSCQCLEQNVWVLSEIDGRYEVCRRCQEYPHKTGVDETNTDGAAHATQYRPSARHLARLLLDFAERHNGIVTQLHSDASLIGGPECPDEYRVSCLDPGRPDCQAQFPASAGLLGRLGGVVRIGHANFENDCRLLQVL